MPRSRPRPDPTLPIEEYNAAILAAAPPLTPEQIRVLRAAIHHPRDRVSPSPQ